MLKTGVSIIIAVLFSTNAFAFTAPSDTKGARALEKAQEAQNEQNEKDFRERVMRLAAEIVFFKEPRTGICFATLGGHRYANITIVPCEKIPPLLLVK